MQHRLVKSGAVVARFFVALVGFCFGSCYFVSDVQLAFLTILLKSWQHARQEINVELKKEAEFFGDIVIVPYLDNYDLVVLKTVAICEYGVSYRLTIIML